MSFYKWKQLLPPQVCQGLKRFCLDLGSEALGPKPKYKYYTFSFFVALRLHDINKVTKWFLNNCLKSSILNHQNDESQTTTTTTIKQNTTNLAYQAQLKYHVLYEIFPQLALISCPGKSHSSLNLNHFGLNHKCH